ncbi:hypothetical protein EKO27_g5199 [Xylaria grammica]|uniref:Uncharacterized protein n=1 Tax=Xylaria grammica TaxID=363999 RepID=A0A439D662_9PEZI|nr:hypothetical protein EKO27_g5199 [Xylaria grammica]
MADCFSEDIYGDLDGLSPPEQAITAPPAPRPSPPNPTLRLPSHLTLTTLLPKQPPHLTLTKRHEHILNKSPRTNPTTPKPSTSNQAALSNIADGALTPGNKDALEPTARVQGALDAAAAAVRFARRVLASTGVGLPLAGIEAEQRAVIRRVDVLVVAHLDGSG